MRVTCEEVITCPTCNSCDVGAGWTGEGELHEIACRACGAAWRISPALSQLSQTFAPLAEALADC